MAKVKVQIVVSAVSQNGDYKGRVINGWETFQIKIKGEPVTKKRQWTMWLELPSNLAKDDVVEFTGELGTKAGTFDKDGQTFQTVEHSINEPSYTVISRGIPLEPKPITELTENPPF
ncbi:MAG: hypothetical protein EBS85_03770 [Micrococcales bacterium]|jgi:hypothetical protein|nr:hypothetical protein [Micrococcales bacterium]